MDKTVLIRVDANKEIAMGHLRRCHTIANEMKKKGIRVVMLLSDSESLSLLKGIDSEGIVDNAIVLEVKYKDKNIYEVLDMSVHEALEFFKNVPQIYRYLNTLEQVGLGYIKLGQPSTQLSGGEAQRVKLATELTKRSTGKTLYILDEPTTGLHFDDVNKLIDVLQQLVDQGNTVVVIEHNLDVIKSADYIIDLGPEGGNRGGTIVTTGTPEEVAEFEGSYTGQFLKTILAKK